MKVLTIVCILLLSGCFDERSSATSLKQRADTQEITLNWKRPTQFQDDSILESSDIAAYILYAGTSKDNLSESVRVEGGDKNSYVFNLSAGVYYFAIAAESIYGDESMISNIVHKELK